MGFNQTALEVDPLALKADLRFKELSTTNDLQFSEEDLEDEKRMFIKKAGGRNLKRIES